MSSKKVLGHARQGGPCCFVTGFQQFSSSACSILLVLLTSAGAIIVNVIASAFVYNCYLPLSVLILELGPCSFRVILVEGWVCVLNLNTYSCGCYACKRAVENPLLSTRLKGGAQSDSRKSLCIMPGVTPAVSPQKPTRDGGPTGMQGSLHEDLIVTLQEGPRISGTS